MRDHSCAENNTKNEIYMAIKNIREKAKNRYLWMDDMDVPVPQLYKQAKNFFKYNGFKKGNNSRAYQIILKQLSMYRS